MPELTQELSPLLIGGCFEPQLKGGEAHPERVGDVAKPITKTSEGQKGTILDNIKNNCNSYPLKKPFTHDCRVAYKNFFFRNRNGLIVPFLCKQWGCQHCNYDKKWRLKFLVQEIAIANNARYFVTLTMRHEIAKEKAPAYFSNVYRKFRVYYKREYGDTFMYCRITELTKSGYPHYHLLTHQRLEIKWLRKTWVACGGGQQIKLVYLQSMVSGDTGLTAIAKYLSSYFSKNDYVLPKGFRHFTTNYEKPPKPEKTSLEPLAEAKWELLVEWTQPGMSIVKKADSDDFGMAMIIYENLLMKQRITERYISMNGLNHSYGIFRERGKESS